MKINPIQPTIPFLMRFKNTDTQTKTSQQPNNGNSGFQRALKEAECQPIRPVFKGHWPNYIQEQNYFEFSGKIPTMTVIPTDEKGNGGKLNFMV